MLSLLSLKRRRQLTQMALKERSHPFNQSIAVVLVVIYNIAGFTDVLSTEYAIKSGAAYEYNPLMRSAMESLSWSEAWVMIKLLLQFTVSAMIVWFPSRTVMSIFAVAVTTICFVVTRNLMIAGLL